MIGNSVIPANSTIGIVNIKDFVSPMVGIPDVGNLTPHSYLFIPPRQEWPDLFVKQMKYLIKIAKPMEITQQQRWLWWQQQQWGGKK